MSNSRLWTTVLSRVQLDISPGNYYTYLAKTELSNIKSDPNNGPATATVSCPNEFVRKQIKKLYKTQLESYLSDIAGQPHRLTLQVGTQNTAVKTNPADLPLFRSNNLHSLNKSTNSFASSSSPQLNPRFTLKTFVVGNSNNLAHAAALGVVDNPGQIYNPLFVYGGVGVGKTHLMQAIGHELLRRQPHFKLVYTTSEEFTNDLVVSIRNKNTSKMKNKYRSADILLVDDIQFLAGKDFSQEEFFHTFNSLYMSGKQIVLTSDRRPDEIIELEQRLVSRFLGGLTVDVQSPDYEMRLAIIRLKLDGLRVDFKPEVVDFLAKTLKSNTREIEGSLIKLASLTRQAGAPLELSRVKQFFGIKNHHQTKTPSTKKIISLSAKIYGYKTSDLVGQCRQANLTESRQIAMYLIREELDLPYKTIGHLFGNRDHTTVLHATRKIDRLYQTNQTIRSRVVDIKSKLT